MNRTLKLASLFLLLGICFFAGNKTTYAKDPVVVEVVLKKDKIADALQAAKAVLLENKFITADGIQESSFTATRTTNAKADYYVADVQATKTDDGVKVRITFVKIGTGLMNLKKTAAQIKKALEEK